jgi:opacity protein-like surface antigen
MKKSAIALTVLSMLVAGAAAPVLAAPYLSVNAGPLWTNNSDLSVQDYDSSGMHDYDVGYSLSVAYGRTSATSRFRPEVEISYRFNDIDLFEMDGLSPEEFDREISFLALMVNAYYDFDTGSAWQPFLGAGIGYGLMQIEGWTTHHDAGAFAYQLIAGCGYALNEKWTIDLQYRLFGTQDPEFTTRDPDVGKITIDSEYLTNTVMLGVRYYF